MKVLIIGGMGVIGGAITEAAAHKDMNVFVVSRREVFDKWKELKIKGLQGDWKNDSFAHKVVTSGFDVIVDTQVFNVGQLKRSLDIANGHCKHYIYISTDSVYDHPGEFITEDRASDTKSLKWKYGHDKRKAELYLIENETKYDFFWTGIRPTITFGETRIPVGFASKRNTYTLVRRIAEGKPVIRFDDPDTRHALCHVSLFGNAVIELFLNKRAAGQFYHISDDHSYTYDEIFKEIEDVIGKKAIFINMSVKPLKKLDSEQYREMIYDKNPVFTLDNSKIKGICKNVNFHAPIENVMPEILVHLQEMEDAGKNDEQYNIISDTLLARYAFQIEDKRERYIAEQYVNGLSESYIRSLKRFNSESIVKYYLRAIKNSLRPIKRILMHK